MKKIALGLAAGVLAGAAGAADIVHQSFGEIAFKTERLSSNESDYLKLPNAWAKAYGSFNKSLKLSPQIAEMVRVRVGQMNRCDYCNVFHTNDALEVGIVPAKVHSISTWRTSGLFSDKERAALAYAEALSSLDHEAMPAAYQQLDAVGFSAVEKEEITNCALLMDVWARVFLAQGKTSYLQVPQKGGEAASKPPQAEAAKK